MTDVDASANPAARIEEAARWRVRLTEQGLESSEAFESWLTVPENAAAWRQVEGPWRDFGVAATTPEMMAAREGALRRARASGQSAATGLRMRALGGIAAGFVALAIGGWFWADAQPDTYRTDLGERRTVALKDGSIMALDSGTEVRVRYTPDARRLELVSGQARFDVAKRPTQPFTVQARDHVVIATGTAFNVDMLGPNVFVTLIEGRVTVVPDDLEAKTRSELLHAPTTRSDVRVLTPGERLLIAPSHPGKVETVTADRALAWEMGQIVFENEPLSSAAARISRYGRQTISTEGPAGDLRITGVFTTGDRTAFIDAVTSYLPVEAVADAKGTVVLRNKRTGAR